MNVKWVVQNNFSSDADDPNWIKRACDKFGYLYEGYKVIPFSPAVPKIAKDVITIFYGGTNWINSIYNNYPDLPGIFFNPDSTFDCWVEKYGKSALNYGALVTTFEDLSELDYEDDTYFFIRPTRDLKEFSGCVLSFKDIKNWCHKIFTDVPDFGKIPIVYGEPYMLSHEWRLFMINGKVCTGSQYRTYGVRNTSTKVPQEVINFAEEQAKVYSPTPIFIMDICRSAGNLYVIEIGCINSAGFYDADIDKFVHDVSDYLMESENV